MSRRGRGRAAVHAPGDGRAPVRQWWVRREGCRTARAAPASDPRRKSSRRHRRRCLHPVADRAMTTALKTRIDPASAYHEPARGDVGVLCLDRNEGLLPSPAALAELAEADPELLRRYPDVSELTALLAAQWKVAADRVLVTAGADEAIDRFFRAFLTRGRTLLLPEPSFEMLDRYAALADGELVRVPWPDAAFPTDEFLERVDARTAVIAIVSPNNPTGGVATLADVRRIAEHAPDALVLLDHAYVEYADDDLTAAVLDVPNVVVVRTMSKAWGLAGCRVGYAVGSPDVIAVLPARGAQHGDHVRTPDGRAHPAPRETPGLRHCADNDHVGEIEHGGADILVRVLDVGLIDQHEGPRRGSRDPSHVIPRCDAAGRIVGRHDDHQCDAVVDAGEDRFEREHIREP